MGLEDEAADNAVNGNRDRQLGHGSTFVLYPGRQPGQALVRRKQGVDVIRRGHAARRALNAPFGNAVTRP